ncbi:MAG: hypothetical protein R3E79_54600 [Caldilineaceae bacterium]
METQQGPIRLKNLLNQAEEQLVTLGQRTPDIKDLLTPAYALTRHNQFWQYQSDGLTLLLAPDMMATYRLPLQFREMVQVNERFYLKPLIPMVTGDGSFYLLTLTQGGVRLLQGSRYSIAEVELGEDIPKSLAEALRYDEFQSQLQLHVASRPSTGGGGRGAAVFHGHGASEDDANMKDNIVRFFRQLDNGVRDLLQTSEQPPLVLAGIEYLRGLYRQVNQYGGLVEGGVEQDPEALSLDELHQRAWAVVEPIFTAERQEALDAYKHLAGTKDERAAQTIEEIAPAAYFQRVDTFFMPNAMTNDLAIWGTFNPGNNKVSIHQERQSGDEDLIDFAAVHTLVNGGDVFITDGMGLPEGAMVAAIMRY